MLFNSYQFLLFFPVVVLLYFALPKKVKNYMLLVASYIFYMGWNPLYAFLLLFCTVVTFGASLIIEKKKFNPKLIVAFSVIIILGMLFYFKYLNFSANFFNNVMSKLKLSARINIHDILLPVGISFFSFQSIGYLIDVYRGDIKAEHNFFKYALFVSFFPQLVAGPIERSKNLLAQLDKTYSFDFDRAKDGLFTMLWGYVLKMVIADRAAIFVDKVYASWSSYTGGQLAVATFFFAIQIYCDFAGYSLIAMGAAKVLGINLMKNFDSPYLSSSVKEFWRRWHISLSTWFRDYLYIPLGGGYTNVWRKRFNILIVMLVSGIWHGAGFSFIAWGLLHGLYQIFDDIVKPIRKYIPKFFQILLTFFAVYFAWIFFRANSFRESLFIIKKIFTDFNILSIFGDTSKLYGLDLPNIHLLLLSLLLLLAVDFSSYKERFIKNWILTHEWYLQVLTFVMGVIFVAIFGIYGNAYDASSFIYFQF